MSDTLPVRGILVGHGSMAAGLVDAVRKIAGVPDEALLPLSNDGRSPPDLSEQIDDLLEGHPGVIFTDLQSGSCAMAAQLTCRDARDRVVVCGTNLPMLLDFVFHRDMPLPELAERLLERGRAGIRTVP